MIYVLRGIATVKSARLKLTSNSINSFHYFYLAQYLLKNYSPHLETEANVYKLRTTCPKLLPGSSTAESQTSDLAKTSPNTSGFYPYTWWAQLAPSEK